MFCATAACFWRSLRNMISRSCVFVCYPLVDPFICKNLMSDLLFGLLHLANRRSAWWTSGESGAHSCWLCQQWMASSVLISFAPSLLHFPCSEARSFSFSHCSPLIFFLLPSLEWNPFPSPTEESHVLGQPGEGLSCFSLPVSLTHCLISPATVLLLQHRSNPSVLSVLRLTVTFGTQCICYSSLFCGSSASVECRWCPLK